MTLDLRAQLRKQQFDPGLLGPFVNPFFLARRSLWSAISKASATLRGRLLDVGCGTKPYRSLFKVDQYTGLDIDSEVSRLRGVADVLYDGTRFPFEDDSFDAVLCNQVFEHVFNPEEFLGEIRRVLAPSGRLLLTVPFVWDEHEQPYDFARYTSFGLRALLERQGLKVVEHHKLLADASIIFQLVNAYLFKVTQTRSAKLNLLCTAVLLAPVSLLGMIAAKMLPANPDLYLDQIIVAERMP